MRRRSVGADPRGSAIVAILVALAMLQILVAAIVFSGTRSDTLSTLRLDAARSLYAAEAGANLAIREVVLNSDADADGGIGSISNDANATNDPAISGARVSVSASTSGEATTAIVTSTAGECARRITLTIE